jgi:nucleotide-binding universal stress UspA family protein
VTTCAAAERLAKLARDLGWTVEVRYAEGELRYTHKGAPKPDGGNFNVQIAEPVWSAGVYATRADRVVAAWYVARDLPERRTATGALSWALDGAIGRRLVGSGDSAGYTPTAFTQDKPKDGPAGPTTLAQIQAYLAEHGAEPVQPDLTIDLGSSVEPARPNWRTAA